MSSRGRLGRPALLALLLAGAALAQQPGVARFALPAGTVTLERLLQTAGASLRWQLSCEAQEVGEVEPLVLQSPIDTDARGGEGVLRALLFARGLALAGDPAGPGGAEVVSLRGPRAGEVFDRAPVLPVADLLRQPHGKRVVATTLVLQHGHASVMVNALRPLLDAGSGQLPGLRLRVDGPRELTLTGWQDRVATMVRIAQACDRPAAATVDLATLVEESARLERRLGALQAKLAELGKTGGGK